MPKVCLNMIVRNEANKMIRCLESVVKEIDCWSITDTGSTDGTQATIQDYFHKHKIPGELWEGPFENFSQARNLALNNARNSKKLVFDYLLLMDADMVLQVVDKKWQKNLKAAAYSVLQTGNQLTYSNTRLLNRWVGAEYKGATHEYLSIDAPASQTIFDGIKFGDFGDGTNRANKYERDIKLLLGDLEAGKNVDRSHFYLGQSYRDAGDFVKAAEHYAKRSTMGGWEEEVWFSKYAEACCYLLMKDHDDVFIRKILDAYNSRPTRAEPLFDLAKYYREKGLNHTSLIFSEAGLAIPMPPDRLFVNEFIYKTGLMEEFSICAFYADAHRKKMGFAATNKLTLSLDAPAYVRDGARRNIYHYLRPLSDRCPSFTAKKIDWTPPDGLVPMNPSIAIVNKELYTIVRCVNYEIDKDGRYLIKGTGGESNQTNPIHTRNFLLRLDDNLVASTANELLPPPFREPEFPLVIGFEDMRLFEHKGEMWTNSCMRQHTKEGWCEQVLARIDKDFKLTDWQRMLPATRVHEKNWMPIVNKDEIKFVYRLGQIVDKNAKVIIDKKVPLAIDRISGGSQVIPYGDGWLACVHEANHIPGTPRRFYMHRFVWWDKNWTVRRISNPFYLHDPVIEFVAGIAFFNDHILLSYGREDKEPWIAAIHTNELHDMVFNEA